ncbi:hypothetical protein CRUP_013371 [Coryphaenoides rupestris]|nr:hypothetical protein CRUP_013371 [Coryphaenoides rupestris]
MWSRAVRLRGLDGACGAVASGGGPPITRLVVSGRPGHGSPRPCSPNETACRGLDLTAQLADGYPVTLSGLFRRHGEGFNDRGGHGAPALVVRRGARWFLGLGKTHLL